MLSRDWCERLAAALAAVREHAPEAGDRYYPDPPDPFWDKTRADPALLTGFLERPGTWYVLYWYADGPLRTAMRLGLWCPTWHQLIALTGANETTGVLAKQLDGWYFGPDAYWLEGPAETPEEAVAHWLMAVEEERRRPDR